MNNDNRFDTIDQRSRTRRMRDFAFALLVAAVATFSLGALQAAADNVDQASSLQAPAVQLSGASGTLEPAC